MFDKADLVVIAKPVSTHPTNEHAALEGISLIGVDTKFETRVVLKGSKQISQLILHHYKLGTNIPIVDGPSLIEFDPSRPGAFLLFLIREADGRYAPVTGQLDVRGFSIVRIESFID
jgi:hypothetical protein